MADAHIGLAFAVAEPSTFDRGERPCEPFGAVVTLGSLVDQLADDLGHRDASLG